MLEATEKTSWRIGASVYLLDELERVLTEKLGFPSRLAQLSRQRAARQAVLVNPPLSRHGVPDDPGDSPILQAALPVSETSCVPLFGLLPGPEMRRIYLLTHIDPR